MWWAIAALAIALAAVALIVGRAWWQFAAYNARMILAHKEWERVMMELPEFFDEQRRLQRMLATRIEALMEDDEPETYWNEGA